jgi:aryl-alcohol dehydrogenase-like predicted oxidoreductase
MQYRYLGNSGLRVSELCFGVMTFGGDPATRDVGANSQAEADRLVATAIDGGVNFFDTADVYAMGESETILGRALGPRRRDVVVTTKVGFRMGDGPNMVGAGRDRIVRGCEESLRRLGTDWIDLLQIHCYDEATPQEETIRALDDLVRQGKVRYVGASNYTGWQMMKALSISDRHGMARFVSHQVRYNLVARGAELELIPLALEEGVGILPWSPLEGGFLTGKYRREQARPEGVRLTDPERHLPFDRERGWNVVDALVDIAADRGATVPQVALRWLLSRPAVSSIVFGARNEAQLGDNLAAADGSLSEDELTRLDEVSRPDPVYPYWFITFMRRERRRARVVHSFRPNDPGP